MLFGQTFGETIITAQVDGAAVTAAAETSLLPAAAKQTMPANFWQIGRKMKVIAWGRVSTVITTPGVFQFKLKFGSTAVFDSLQILPDSLAAYTTVGWRLEIDVTCRAIGSSANLMGQGIFESTDILGTPQTPPKGGINALLPWNSAPAVGSNFDSTATQVVDLTFTQTVTTGSITLHQYELILPN